MMNKKVLLGLGFAIILAVLLGVGLFLMTQDKNLNAGNKPWDEVIAELMEHRDAMNNYVNEFTNDEENLDTRLDKVIAEIYKLGIAPSHNLLKNYDCTSLEDDSESEDCQELKENFAIQMEAKAELLEGFKEYTIAEIAEASEEYADTEAFAKQSEASAKIEEILRNY
jgi:chaperonin cofactor prefoldin